MLDRNRLTGGAARNGLLAAALVAALYACGDTVTQISEEDVVELRLSSDSVQVAIGSSLKLVAFPLDASGALLVGQEASWTSANSQVATVDEDGLVNGITKGSAYVTARIGGFADSTFVEVDVAPVLTLSGDSVGFEVSAGGADPAPQSIAITNTGGLTLTGLSVDSTVYGAGASGWVASQLNGSVAPTSLQLNTVTSAITTVGIYSATVWLSAPGAGSSPDTIEVTLEVSPGPPSSSAFQIVTGNLQTAVSGTSVTTSPTVVLRDAFDNLVPGATIAFSASGGGSVNPPAVVTDAQGRASTTWTVSATGHVMASNGTFQNTLTASVTGLTPLQFVGFARYSFPTHVIPIFSTVCSGCHNGSFVYVLSHASLVGVASNCNSAYPRVSSAGGDTGANNSILLYHLTPGATPPCGFSHIEPWADANDPNLVILRSWIRNGAPDN